VDLTNRKPDKRKQERKWQIERRLIDKMKNNSFFISFTKKSSIFALESVIKILSRANAFI